MTLKLPWHSYDIATAPKRRQVVIEVGNDGKVVTWWESGTLRTVDADDPWPADAIPDFTDVGTAARWLQSCLLATEQPTRGKYDYDLWNDVRRVICDAQQWLLHDTRYVSAAVTATREWLRVRGAR